MRHVRFIRNLANEKLELLQESEGSTRKFILREWDYEPGSGATVNEIKLRPEDAHQLRYLAFSDSAPEVLLQKIADILGLCVFDQPDSIDYSEALVRIRALVSSDK